MAAFVRAEHCKHHRKFDINCGSCRNAASRR